MYKTQTYFITINNIVYACGNNSDGQLGIGSHDEYIYIPQKVLIEEKIKDIIFKYSQIYFITIDDECYACGHNNDGQLGIGSHDKDVYIPQKVLIEEKIKNIKGDYYHTHFITIDDECYACGNNDDGHLGIGSHVKDVYIPQKVLIEEKIKNIKGDYYHTYFTTIDNTVYACGANNAGQLGIGSDDKYIYNPQKVLIEEKIKDIKFKCQQTYFTTINDEFYACGNNKFKKLGISSHDNYVNIPQKVILKEKIKDVKLEDYQTYFTTINDKVYICGYNRHGQLGVGSRNKVIYIPQKVLIKEKIKCIKSDNYHTYFITINDEVYASGDNTYGQLGIGSHNKYARVPHKVLIEEKIKNIKIHYNITYFKTINNKVYICGHNESGQIEDRSSNEVIRIPERIK